MNPLKLKKDIAETSIPRESGDEPEFADNNQAMVGYSPRERG